MNLHWNDRSTEEQSLFNPAFCSLLLRATCKAYNAGEPSMPLPLAFLLLPIILNERMRTSLPTLRTFFGTWATGQTELIADFGDRARDMVDVTREAIQFGCAQDWLSVSPAGLKVGSKAFRPDPPRLATDTDDVRACYTAAKFLGRWFTQTGTPATIMSLLGVAP